LLLKYHTVVAIPKWNIKIVVGGNIDHTNIWLLTFLAWYRHFNKNVSGLNLLMVTYLFYCEVKRFAETVIHCQFGLDRFYSTCTGKCICLLGISSLYLSIGFCNCSDNVIFVIFHDWTAMFVTRETRRSSQLEQGLLIVQEYLASLLKTKNHVCIRQFQIISTQLDI
jgi:hypothetical protein